MRSRLQSLRSGLFHLLHSQQYLNYTTPDKKLELFSEHRHAIGLRGDVTFGAEAFDNHFKNRIQDHTGFKTQIGTDKDNTLEKVIKNEPEKTAILNKFEQIFKPSEDYLKAQKAYNEEIENVKKLVAEVPQSRPVEGIREKLENAKQLGKKAIEAQHKLEEDELAKAFKDNSFIAQFKKASGFDKDKEIEKIQEDLTAELEQKHKKELDEFEKSCNDNITVLDKAANLERDQFIFNLQIREFYSELNEEQRHRMQMEIARVRRDNKEKYGEPPENSSVQCDISDKGISVNVDPNDLKFIISMTGKEIKHTNSDGKNFWTLDFPPRILAPSYYASNKEAARSDMTVMAAAIKASGIERITMNVNFTDEGTANDRAKQAYKACLDTGFPPDKITIKVNGTEMKADKIFGANVLKTLHGNAEADRKKLAEGLKKVNDQPNNVKQADLKNGMNQIRSEEQAKAAATQKTAQPEPQQGKNLPRISSS